MVQPFAGDFMRNAIANSFQYPVAKLLEALKKNRETHLTEYKDATSNYRKLLGEELITMQGQVEQGLDIDHYVHLKKPESHVKEYDQAIAMLEMTSETQIEIDGHTFAKLVMDEWDWQQSFSSNTKMYTTMALQAPGAYTNIRV